MKHKSYATRYKAKSVVQETVYFWLLRNSTRIKKDKNSAESTWGTTFSGRNVAALVKETQTYSTTNGRQQHYDKKFYAFIGKIHRETK